MFLNVALGCLQYATKNSKLLDCHPDIRLYIYNILFLLLFRVCVLLQTFEVHCNITFSTLFYPFESNRLCLYLGPLD